MCRSLARGLSLLVVALAILTGASASEAEDQKPIPVTIGWQPGGCFAFYVARDLKLFEQAGLAPTYVKFTAGPPMFAAFQSSSIDVSWGGAAPAVIGVAQGVPLKIISLEASTQNALVARKDRQIRSLADVKGKKIGTVKGSAAYFAMVKLLQMNGLDKQYTFLDMQMPSLLPAFAKGDVDAIWAWEPWASKAEAEDGLRIADEIDIFRAYPGAPFMARTGWLQDQPEAARRFLKAIHVAQQAYAKDPGVAVRVMAREVGIPETMARKVFDHDPKPTLERQASPTDAYSIVAGPDKNGQVRIFQTVADFFFDNGFIKSRPSMAEAFDAKPLVDAIKTGGR